MFGLPLELMSNFRVYYNNQILHIKRVFHQNIRTFAEVYLIPYIFIFVVSQYVCYIFISTDTIKPLLLLISNIKYHGSLHTSVKRTYDHKTLLSILNEACFEICWLWGNGNVVYHVEIYPFYIAFELKLNKCTYMFFFHSKIS